MVSSCSSCDCSLAAASRTVAVVGLVAGSAYLATSAAAYLYFTYCLDTSLITPVVDLAGPFAAAVAVAATVMQSAHLQSISL